MNMISFVIENIDDYTYTLKNNNETIKRNIKFYDLDEECMPKVGDKILVNQDFLFLGSDIVIRYGDMDSPYGNRILGVEDNDLLVLVKDTKKYYLKRIYG